MNININTIGDTITFDALNKRALILIDGLEPYIDDDGRVWENGEVDFNVELYDEYGDMIDSDVFVAVNEANRIAEAKDKAILWVMHRLI